MAAACCLDIGGTYCFERMSWLKQVAKVDGSAVLCKENSCALINASLELKPVCFDEKTLKKGRGSCISLLLLKAGPQPTFTSGTGLRSMKIKLAIWQSSGYWICLLWNVEWDRTGLPPAPTGPSTTPFSSCHPERISHKWLRDHKVFYTDVIL